MIPSCILYMYIMVFLLLPMEGKKSRKPEQKSEKNIDWPTCIGRTPRASGCLNWQVGVT